MGLTWVCEVPSGRRPGGWRPGSGSDEVPGFESSKGRSHGTKPEGVPSHRPRRGSGSETWSGEDTYGDEEVRSTQGDQSSEDEERQDGLFPYGEERSEVLSNEEGRNDYFPKEERHDVLFSEKKCSFSSFYHKPQKHL